MELYLLNGSIMLTGFARNETSLNRTLGRGSAFGTERMLSPTGYTTTGVVLTFISVFGIVNNFFVFLILVRNRPLRTPVNLMILSLSLSEYYKCLYVLIGLNITPILPVQKSVVSQQSSDRFRILDQSASQEWSRLTTHQVCFFTLQKFCSERTS